MGSFLDQLKNTFKSTQEMSVVMPNLKEFVEGFGAQFGLDNVFVTMEGSRTGVSEGLSFVIHLRLQNFVTERANFSTLQFIGMPLSRLMLIRILFRCRFG